MNFNAAPLPSMSVTMKARAIVRELTPQRRRRRECQLLDVVARFLAGGRDHQDVPDPEMGNTY
jgi:hypothetical protein